MLTIFICLALIYAFYIGYRRGLILQAVRLLGYGISCVLATYFYEPIAKIVEMIIPFPQVSQGTTMAIYSQTESLGIQDAFYRVAAFILIGLLGWLITNFISVLLNKVTYYDFFKYINRIGGGLINCFIMFVMLFIVLFVLSLVPIEFIQQQFVDNPLAFNIVAKTPFLADFAAQYWLQFSPL